MEQAAVDLMVNLINTALPVAVIIEFANLAISTFMRTAFGGRMYIGR